MLNDIVTNKRREVIQLAELTIAELPRDVRDFNAALRAHSLGIIAELKSRSPSAGQLTNDYQPVTQALLYQQGGADARALQPRLLPELW